MNKTKKLLGSLLLLSSMLLAVKPEPTLAVNETATIDVNGSSPVAITHGMLGVNSASTLPVIDYKNDELLNWVKDFNRFGSIANLKSGPHDS